MVSSPGWLEQKAPERNSRERSLGKSAGQTTQDPARQAKEVVNNGEPLRVLVSNGEQILRTDGINTRANARCS